MEKRVRRELHPFWELLSQNEDVKRIESHILYFFSQEKRWVLIFCFPPEKQKFLPFCGTNRNKNNVVFSTPNSLLMMIYINVALSNLHHHIDTSLPLSLSPATNLLSVPQRNRELSCLTDLAMLFLLTEHFPHIFSHSHCLFLTSMLPPQGGLCREVSTCPQSYLALNSFFSNFFISLSPLIKR